MLADCKKALDKAVRPLFFFDGDIDGLVSFLLLYKYKGDGKGVMVSGRPAVTSMFLQKIEEYQPDAIFILDLALIEEEVLSAVKTPLIWIDHHDVQTNLPAHVTYFNPKQIGEDAPTSYWAYKLTEQHLWLAIAGIIGDYHFSLAAETKKAYPDLLPEGTKNQGDALYNTPLGKLIRIISFNLKGSISDSMKSVKTLTRITHYNEILEQTSAKGRFLYKKYERVNKVFQELIKQVPTAEKLIVFIYKNDKVSVSSELANEIKWRNPKKVIIIGRNHGGKIAMSVRSETKEIHDPFIKAINEAGGYGGGHPKACGGVVSQDKFELFKEKFIEYSNKK